MPHGLVGYCFALGGGTEESAETHYWPSLTVVTELPLFSSFLFSALSKVFLFIIS